MIAIDWGTSSLRAYRLDAHGSLREQRGTAAALLDCQGRFEDVLARLIDGWDDDNDDRLVVLGGMIGSRNGWLEVPYVACPAGAAELAAGLRTVAAASLPGRTVLIAPGVAQRIEGRSPEVMRGEEVQLIGLARRLGESGRHLVCLPGTHCKWVWLDGGRITALRTAMTGELYALLRRHSLLAALMPPIGPGAGEPDRDDPDAFLRGVRASITDGGLLNHLFGVRALGLFDQLPREQAPSYLSGLLIGHELHGLLGAPGASRGSGAAGFSSDTAPVAVEAPVHLVGEAALLRRYVRALSEWGVQARPHDGALAAEGLYRLVG